MDLLSDEEGKLAMQLARGTLGHVLLKKPEPAVKLTPVFEQKRGVFVTLTIKEQLRGCIGFPYPVIPLGDAIRQAAVAAALEDPRFRPVTADELKKIDLEVTVLTPPQTMEGDPEDRPNKVVVGKHGLIIRGRGTSGLLLPQVATDYSWDARTFLDHTCTKAGLPENAWHDSRVELLTFEGQIFSEHR
ncbi:MAG: TIGR00296 family protein [Methanomicrobiales archaeon]|nr:TIGR00296 family protein [Methanomicrobiales archaeon]